MCTHIIETCSQHTSWVGVNTHIHHVACGEKEESQIKQYYFLITEIVNQVGEYQEGSMLNHAIVYHTLTYGVTVQADK